MTSARNRGKAMSRAELARLWADRRISREEIGRRLGITAQAVSWRARTLGLPPRPEGSAPRFDHHDPLFFEMWHANVRPAEMGRHFGVGLSAILANARRLGLSRECHRHNSIDLAAFREMQLSRALAAQAAEERAALRLAEMVDAPSLMWAGAGRVAA